LLTGSPIAVFRINRARRNEAQLRVLSERRVYAADMKLAQRALEMNNIGGALNLLNRYRPKGNSETDFRGWEWRYLWSQCQSEADSVFSKPPGPVRSLSVSHDGAWLAIGLSGTGASIWDLATREEIARLPASGEVRVAFSPRELLLAYSDVPNFGSASTNYCIHLWDGVSRRIVSRLPVSNNCYGVAFSEDGNTLVTSTQNVENNPLLPGFITLWRVSDGSMLTNYPVRQYATAEGTPFALARDLSIAAHLFEHDKVRVLDLATGQERWNRKGTDDYIMALALSPDGKLLASGEGFSDSTIRLWDVASGRELGRLEGHRAGIHQLIFWPDGKTLGSASLDQTIRLWDVSDPANGHAIRILRGHRGWVRVLAVLPDTTTLVSGSDDGTVCLWNTVGTPKERNYLTLPRSRIHPTRDGVVGPWRFTADSKCVVTVEDNQDGVSVVTRWQGKDFQTRQPLLIVGTNIYEACFSEDGRWLAASWPGGDVEVWDLQNTRQSCGFTAMAWPVIPRGFTGEGRKLMITHTKDNSLHEWDLATRQETRSWPPAPGRYTGALSSNGTWYLTSIDNPDTKTITSLTELSSRREMSLNLGGWYITASFSPDGRFFALGNWGSDARLFETATAKEIAKLAGIFGQVHGMGFSPDGRRFMTSHGSGGDESVALWDMESYEKLLALEGRGSLFDVVAFSPDGNVLAASNWRGALLLWRAPSWAEIDAAEQVAAQTQVPSR